MRLIKVMCSVCVWAAVNAKHTPQLSCKRKCSQCEHILCNLKAEQITQDLPTNPRTKRDIFSEGHSWANQKSQRLKAVAMEHFSADNTVTT